VGYLDRTPGTAELRRGVNLGLSNHVNLLISGAVVCSVWLLANEFLFRLTDIASSLSAGTPGANILGTAMLFWRMFPIITFVGIFLYALLSATQDEPFEYAA